MSEFELIRRYFSDLGAARADVSLGVGDDCALLSVPPDQMLAVSIDTLNVGVHFFPDVDPASLGHKALAVGLSDLAAMGAEPVWATLALTLPDLDLDWVHAFALGFGCLADVYGVRLVGGDTTRGPLSVTVQVHGLVPQDMAIRRAGARPGDAIFVSGTLGDSALALRLRQDGKEIPSELQQRLDLPEPRVALGLHLRGIASAAIDLSDGLAGDLGHILEASGVGAELELKHLPLSPRVAEAVAESRDWSLPLQGGDDYELCVCVPPDRIEMVEVLATTLGVPLARVGWIRSALGIEAHLPNGGRSLIAARGYDHFTAIHPG
ncbi:thiamine-phosphate kinase [Caldichromatium japonicum]|uniref:Thiamine-monophosphate kinase n=1 Tax=Caldichromatium japonicum TaxID=2699430 RepID=A0A6G7VCC2_9GAMM|nr:thiamine-phosphate kinase [Caldichromatium japonicum]QIK37437.1 thiamine-phosphate kinase [Caldichromatium japonicum]